MSRHAPAAVPFTQPNRSSSAERRAGRELALGLLFQVDVGRLDLEEVLRLAAERSGSPPEVMEFARELTCGVAEHQEQLDAIIQRYAEGWTLERMAAVDRVLMRIALFEILHRDDIRVGVSINEAVELAKEYSTAESGRFVNGILGNFVRTERTSVNGQERRCLMSAQILDGKSMAAQLRAEAAERVQALQQRHGRTPGLAVILVGEDPASKVYVGMKERACAQAGIRSRAERLPESTSESDLLALVDELNRDPEWDGILVQHPLPEHINEQRVFASLSPAKDVDGVGPSSMGRVLAGDERAYGACTAAGIVEILRRAEITIKGAEAVVVGRSLIVGKPAALLLLNAHATVTVCHSRTRDLADVTRRADILVAAVGKPEFITGDMLKPGCVVIDAGYNRVPGRKGDVGDVHFESAVDIASAITPVPGGVGPMTIAMLIHHTVLAAERATSSA